MAVERLNFKAMLRVPFYMKQDNFTRWFVWPSTKTLMLYKRERCSRGYCNIWTEKDAKDHLDRKCLTNIEYVEALSRLKEINKNA